MAESENKISENTKAESFQKICLYINILIFVPISYFYRQLQEFNQLKKEFIPYNPSEQYNFYYYAFCWAFIFTVKIINKDTEIFD